MNDDAQLEVTEEYVLTKYDGNPEEGATPIEVIRVDSKGNVTHEYFPPPMDSTLAVNLGGLDSGTH